MASLRKAKKIAQRREKDFYKKELIKAKRQKQKELEERRKEAARIGKEALGFDKIKIRGVKQYGE